MSGEAARSSSRPVPPSGSPWDDPLEAAPLAFVDLEMSGLDPARHRVIQLCIERVVGGETVAALMSTVRPGDEPVEESRFHGVRASEMEQAPQFEVLADRVVELLDGAVLVAHAAKHDVAFLRAELARAGREWSCPFFLDTLHLSRRAFNFRSHRLEALARELSIDNPAPHRADNDVRVLRRLFERLVEVLEPTTPRDLWHVRAGERDHRPEVLAALERALTLGVGARLRYRPAGKAAQEMSFHVTGVRRDVDPPVAIGYLTHTRGRRELRIDRILSIELLAPRGAAPRAGAERRDETQG